MFLLSSVKIFVSGALRTDTRLVADNETPLLLFVSSGGEERQTLLAHSVRALLLPVSSYLLVFYFSFPSLSLFLYSIRSRQCLVFGHSGREWRGGTEIRISILIWLHFPYRHILKAV